MEKVSYLFLAVLLYLTLFTGNAFSDYITNIQISPSSPAALPFNQHVDITFDYLTSEAGGVRIFVRPFTNGALSPNYAAHGSPLYPAGSGSGTGYITIISGQTTVDQLRFRMYNDDQSVLLLEFFIPVEYIFSDHVINNIQISPPSPAALPFNQHVDITFDYLTNEMTGVRIFVRPFTNGSMTPNYAAHGSPLYPAGSGNGTGYITVMSGQTTVDQLRFRMYNDDQSVLLLEFFVPVDYIFANHAITNIQISPPSPASLAFNQYVDITFDYLTNEASGVHIFVRPFTNGALTPNYGAHGSPIYPVGSGSGTGFVTISSGQTVVDQLRFQMVNSDVLLEFFVPVQYIFSYHSITNIQLNPSPPAFLALNQNVNISFDYETNEASGVHIFVRPFTNGDLTPNYSAHGSPIYPVGSGGGTGFFTIMSGQAVVDQLRFRMTNADVLLEFFLPVEYHFGIVSGLNTENNQLGIPTKFQLLPNYPNPFNSSTNIEFRIPKKEFVTLKVFNILGEEVAMLVSGQVGAGSYSFDFDASDLPSGLYLYRLQAVDHSSGSEQVPSQSSGQGFVQTRKMVLIR